MVLNAFTAFHVVLSLVGIGSGVVAVYGLLKAKTPDGWTQTVLATTAATSLTGFLFPFHSVTPAQVLGVLSLIALIIESLSIYRNHLQGIWWRTYAVTAVMALYFNVFRARCPGIPPGSGTDSHGADAVGAAFPDRAARRAAAVSGDWNSRRDRKAATRACHVIHQS
jgi:hypothetical protein